MQHDNRTRFVPVHEPMRAGVPTAPNHPGFNRNGWHDGRVHVHLHVFVLVPHPYAGGAPALAATSRAIFSSVDSSLRGALGSSISSTFRHSDCSSLSSTLNDSGRPDSSTCSPLTMASYMRVRPTTSSDLTVKNSCR